MMTIIAITSGEPAGIGPDICLQVALIPQPCTVVVLGDMNVLQNRADALNLPVRLVSYEEGKVAQPNELLVWHVPVQADVVAGQLQADNSHYVLKMLDVAFDGIQNGVFSAMVTAPVHKGIINDAGVNFSGHTEYLADKSKTPKVVMMLAGGGLRVALATTHLPLIEVSNNITQESLHQVIDILYADLCHKFHIEHPTILVAGLNPHAGEGGHMGTEEIDIIEPVLTEYQQRGWDIRGPYPADTLFQPFMLKDADAVLAMYHDQGLPVLKYASFGKGVNITLGLPFIRTSVDHGTALDLAGSGQADAGSLMVAITEAYKMLPITD